MENKFLKKSKNKSQNKSQKKNSLFLLFFLISFIMYTVYCIYHQGSFVRGVGWRTKTEYPLSYNITLICSIIIPVGIIYKQIIMRIEKYKIK